MCRLARGHSGPRSGSGGDNSAVNENGENTVTVEGSEDSVINENGEKAVPVDESDEESEESYGETENTGETDVEAGEQETAPQIKVKVGQRIQGVHRVSGELKSGRILSRAGKSTGKYKHCYNIKWDLDGSESWADIQEDFSDLQVMEDNVEMMVLFNSEEVLCAKKKELKS